MNDATIALLADLDYPLYLTCDALTSECEDHGEHLAQYICILTCGCIISACEVMAIRVIRHFGLSELTYCWGCGSVKRVHVETCREY